MTCLSVSGQVEAPSAASTIASSEPFDRETVELFRSSLDPLEWAGFRERSWRMREFLARACTNGRASFVELLGECSGPAGSAGGTLFDATDQIAADALVRLARLVSNQALDHDDRAAALALYGRAAALCPARFRDVDVTRYVLLLGCARRVADARAVLGSPLGAALSPLEQALLRCNLRVWPAALPPEKLFNASHRLDPLNALFARADLAPLGLGGSGSCFERLDVPLPPPPATRRRASAW